MREDLEQFLSEHYADNAEVLLHSPTVLFPLVDHALNLARFERIVIV